MLFTEYYVSYRAITATVLSLCCISKHPVCFYQAYATFEDVDVNSGMYNSLALKNSEVYHMNSAIVEDVPIHLSISQ